MGDIADMILEGILCEECGVYIGDGGGFPRTCDGCRTDRGENRRLEARRERKLLKQQPKSITCAECAKKFWTQQSMMQHCRDKHAMKEPTDGKT